MLLRMQQRVGTPHRVEGVLVPVDHRRGEGHVGGLHADAVGRVAARGPRAPAAIVSARRGEQRVDRRVGGPRGGARGSVTHEVVEAGKPALYVVGLE